MQVELPFHRVPLKIAIPREEIASSRLSLEAKIDRFQLKEEREEQGEPVIQVSNSKDVLDRFSSVHTSGLVVARIASDSKEEEDEEEMPLEWKKGLRELLANRAKGSVPKDASGSQPPLPPPPLPPSAHPFALANL